VKTYRVYFNRKAEWPQVWSVDEGHQDSEISVQAVEIRPGAVAISKAMNPEECSRFDKDIKPYAWLEVTGWLKLGAGVAIFD
jgi:hypothetical protein